MTDQIRITSAEIAYKDGGLCNDDKNKPTQSTTRMSVMVSATKIISCSLMKRTIKYINGARMLKK